MSRLAVLLTAGAPALGWTAVLARLSRQARDHVRQLDLRTPGITDFGRMKSRGSGPATTPAHCELFFDGMPMYRPIKYIMVTLNRYFPARSPGLYHPPAANTPGEGGQSGG